VELMLGPGAAPGEISAVIIEEAVTEIVVVWATESTEKVRPDTSGWLGGPWPP
jgi:hypothetical protein